jgi:hypothetical protein
MRIVANSTHIVGDRSVLPQRALPRRCGAHVTVATLAQLFLRISKPLTYLDLAGSRRAIDRLHRTATAGDVTGSTSTGDIRPMIKLTQLAL